MRPVVPLSVSAPILNLQIGGAIRGNGEKFAANPVTGIGSMTVPIAISPGRSSFGPQPNLSYDSGSGNGLLVFGWSLRPPSVTRKTETSQDAIGASISIWAVGIHFSLFTRLNIPWVSNLILAARFIHSNPVLHVRITKDIYGKP